MHYLIKRIAAVSTGIYVCVASVVAIICAGCFCAPVTRQPDRPDGVEWESFFFFAHGFLTVVICCSEKGPSGSVYVCGSMQQWLFTYWQIKMHLPKMRARLIACRGLSLGLTSAS